MSNASPKILIALVASSLGVAATPPVAYASVEDTIPHLMRQKAAQPIEYQRRSLTLEEMIQTSPFPAQFVQPIPLHGINISGLQPKSIDQLGMHYFLVVDNTKYSRMSEIYRDSRVTGKSNFVTADSIIHPYIAFSNRVLADSAISHMAPDMVLLLDAMNKVALEDYKDAQDAEVRQDIARNVAYIAVALRLLNPRYEIPRISNVPEMVDEDLKAIAQEKTAQSAVFEREEDFANFRPMGFYNTSPQLQNFYRCREWLSRISFPVIDVSSGNEGRATNQFRRSVLLFRSLDQAQILGKPASELWAKLTKGFALLGTPTEYWSERTLYPTEYKIVFQNRSSNLKVTLDALAEPLFRTKLLLAVRKQKPVNLGSASIFEIEDGSAGSSSIASFRLFPVVGEPESPWLKLVAKVFPAERQATSAWPVSLLSMYSWGSAHAGNMLASNLYNLDPMIAQALPELQHCVMRRVAGGQTQYVDSRPWKILSPFFKPLPETTPQVMRTEMWASRRLLSAMGGWVDAQTAIAPSALEGLTSTETTTTASGDTDTAVPAPEAAGGTNAIPIRRKKIQPYHWLDPSIEVYQRLEQDAHKIQTDLQATGYLPEKYKARFGDFGRLFQRLQKIAEFELRGQPITAVDKKLLAQIDLILDKVDVPLPSVVTYDPGKRGGREAKEGEFKGLNMAVGRPGLLYVIYQNPGTMEWTLGRGAVYTYYEMPAPLLTDSMWKHKIEAGFAKPPIWAAKFEIVQQATEDSKGLATK